MADSEDSLPRLLGGRYRLDAKLGHGGMGVVYRGTDMTMQRAVAVKLIRGDDGVEIDEDVAGRFLREAKNTARVQHEHIIEVFDFGRSASGDLFFVMELLEGESLSARLRREGRLAPDVVVHIGSQICSALEIAHRAGVIHRDLKPANVMLTSRARDDDYVKVLDFGVAKSYSPDQETQLTHTGMLVGTLDYMAPEQIMGRKVDGRTDVYSLGVVLYRMLTGRAPFRDGAVPALIHAHLNVQPKPIGAVVRDVPPELEAVVMRSLEKDPDRRWQSMDIFGRALVDALRVGIVDLEYTTDDEDDPYGGGDATEVVRPNQPALAGSELPDVPESFEDATVKMDRSGSGPISRAPARNTDFSDRTEVMVKEESTAKREVPEALRRQPRPTTKACAMCMTHNPPHARSCGACGVSLAAEDQAMVRERVNPPRTARLAAPMQPPPTSGAFPANNAMPGPSISYPQIPMQNAQVSGAYASKPTGFWQRFWASLRGR